MEYDKKCIYCGKRYKAARSDSKTCSSTCRVAYSYVKKEMQFIGTIPAIKNEKGGCTFQQDDLDNLCSQDNSCKLYLRFDGSSVMNVYGVGCDNSKRYCNNKKKGINTNHKIMQNE
jgi:hypothetical protein